MGKFDFDHWSQLARRDPEAFFRARKTEIERFISAHPPEVARRLQEIQQRIDCTRIHAGSPLKALGVLIGMMQDRLRLLRIQTELLARSAGRLRDEMATLTGQEAGRMSPASTPPAEEESRRRVERRRSATR